MSKSASPAGSEKRRSRRRPILDSFSLFVVIPRRGGHRLTIHDLSDAGMLIDIDMEGEAAGDNPLTLGESMDTQFYLNQSLYLPLAMKVARIDETGPIRKVGLEFTQKSSKEFKAYASFLQMLDNIVESAVVTR